MSMKTPVRYPVKFYSYKDDEAISLQDADGCIKTIIKSCLVTGYGTKESAGWAMPFEDDFRMILRRPLRTGNPPDIRIENGVIDGAASHRIVGLDNTTAIDDGSELGVVNFLTRDTKAGQQWYLMATDFGFVFFYEMAENGYRMGKPVMALQYIGGAGNLIDADSEYHIAIHYQYQTVSGVANPWGYWFLYRNNGFMNLRSGQKHQSYAYLNLSISELANDAYWAQQVIVDSKFILPFSISASLAVDNYIYAPITIAGRPFFRCINARAHSTYPRRAVYVPLDYWEL